MLPENVVQAAVVLTVFLYNIFALFKPGNCY